MIYGLSLRTIGVLVGLLLAVAHLFALLRGDLVLAWLKEFPRSRPAGLVLVTVAAIWTFWLVATIDLGEFSNLRTMLLVAIPVGAFLTARFVPEFLAVRSLAMLLLLAADPLLEAAFLRPEKSRLLLVILAYAWAVKGIFWVGLPYLFRDQVAWIQSRPGLWKAATGLGVAYGCAILLFAFSW